MNDINKNEKQLLEELKRKIENISGHGHSINWLQKDYEYLIYLIENETGLQISLSTIKRIWRNQYNRLPHLSTLDALAKLGYKTDWLSLKKQYIEKKSLIANSPKPVRKKNNTILLILLVVIGISSISLFLIIKGKNKSTGIKDVKLLCKKTSNKEIPKPVVFSYNLEDVEADKFYIQQSWDYARRIEVDKNSTMQNDTYYVPGYFNARLIADGEVISRTPVHVVYDNWYVAARQHPTKVTPFNESNWLKEDYLGVSKKTLMENNININKGFQLNYYNSRDFQVDGDNFIYSSSFKMDSLSSIACPKLMLIIRGAKSLHWLNFGYTGCESNLDMDISELYYNGKFKDLSMFGLNIYSWQNVIVRVINKNLSININGSKIFECTYVESIGDLKSINYYFTGIGAIDNVELKDSKGTIKFYDDFQ